MPLLEIGGCIETALGMKGTAVGPSFCAAAAAAAAAAAGLTETGAGGFVGTRCCMLPKTTWAGGLGLAWGYAGAGEAYCGKLDA